MYPNSQELPQWIVEVNIPFRHVRNGHLEKDALAGEFVRSHYIIRIVTGKHQETQAVQMNVQVGPDDGRDLETRVIHTNKWTLRNFSDIYVAQCVYFDVLNIPVWHDDVDIAGVRPDGCGLLLLIGGLQRQFVRATCNKAQVIWLVQSLYLPGCRPLIRNVPVSSVVACSLRARCLLQLSKLSLLAVSFTWCPSIMIPGSGSPFNETTCKGNTS